MDSFRMFFERDVSPSEVSEALRGAGFGATEKPGEVQIWKDNAHVCFYLDRPEEISEEDLYAQNEWPIPRERLSTLMGIEVRRNDESTDLAMTVATNSRRNSADSMDYWEQVYKAYLATKEKTAEGTGSTLDTPRPDM